MERAKETLNQISKLLTQLLEDVKGNGYVTTLIHDVIILIGLINKSL